MIGEAPSVVVSDTAKLLYIQKNTKKDSLKQPINPKHKLLIINAVVFANLTPRYQAAQCFGIQAHITLRGIATILPKAANRGKGYLILRF